MGAARKRSEQRVARQTEVVREGSIDDALDLFELERAVVDAGVGVVQEREDLAPSVEQYRHLLAARLSDQFQHLLVAVDGRTRRVRGYAEWSRLRPAKLRHVVSVALGVHPVAQGRGMGRALMERLIEDARLAEPRVRRVELGVLADNMRARSLYESLGFRVEGVRRGFVKDARGERDDCLMALHLT